MSTTPTSGLLNILTAVNAEMSLGVAIGNTVVPLVVGLVKDIKSRVVGQTVEYTVTLSTTQAILDAIIASGSADLESINAELKRLGVAPIANPAPKAAIPPAPIPSPGA